MTDDKKDPKEIDWELFPYDFKELSRQLLVEEIRTMIRRLQEHGDFNLPASVDFSKMDHRGLNFLKRQLRDTLRTLGGGR